MAPQVGLWSNGPTPGCSPAPSALRLLCPLALTLLLPWPQHSHSVPQSRVRSSGKAVSKSLVPSARSCHLLVTLLCSAAPLLQTGPVQRGHQAAVALQALPHHPAPPHSQLHPERPPLHWPHVDLQPSTQDLFTVTTALGTAVHTLLRYGQEPDFVPRLQIPGPTPNNFADPSQDLIPMSTAPAPTGPASNKTLVSFVLSRSPLLMPSQPEGSGKAGVLMVL